MHNKKEFLITTLSKKFIYFILLFLSLFIFLIFIHPDLNNKINLSEKVSAITKLSNLAYSNNIYESRIKDNKDFSNKVHNIPLQIKYLDFTYEY